MKILIISHYYPPEVGGSALTMSQQAQWLRQAGHTVTVLTGMPNYPSGIIPAKYRGKAFYRETADNADVRRVWVYTSPAKRNRVRLLNQISFMLMAMIRGTFLPRPDVILVESHPLFVCLSSGWLRRLKRAPVILNVSDLWPESAVAVGALRPNSFIVRTAERVARWAYHDAAALIAMTEGVRQGILKVCPAEVALIRYPVDLERFRPNLPGQRDAMRIRLGLKGDEFVVAFPGNMSLVYDFNMMLDAAQALPEFRFLLAGGGSQAGYVADQIKRRGLTNFLEIGLLPHEEMPALWAAVDVCFLAIKEHSLFMGTLPAKMLEAMAAGIPTVAAIRGEATTLLNDTGAGIAVVPGDTPHMIAALRGLHADPDTYQRYSTACRSYAEKIFAADKVQALFLSIFDRVLKR